MIVIISPSGMRPPGPRAAATAALAVCQTTGTISASIPTSPLTNKSPHQVW